MIWTAVSGYQVCRMSCLAGQFAPYFSLLFSVFFSTIVRGTALTVLCNATDPESELYKPLQQTFSWNGFKLKLHGSVARNIKFLSRKANLHTAYWPTTCLVQEKTSDTFFYLGLKLCC